MADLRAAVIGVGFIGTVHAEAVRRVGARLVGVHGSSPASSERGAQRIGTTPLRTFEEVLESEADIVHITTPNVRHAEQSIALLRAGKHVICEKPLATDLAAAQQMTVAARESGLVHATCFNFRFYPLIQEARSRVVRGDLGPVHLITGHYLQDWLLKATDWNWRLDADVGGLTRSVADIGSHWLDAVQFVADMPITRVMADLQTVHETRWRPEHEVETFTATEGELHEIEIRTDDAANLLLRFSRGAHGALSVSQVSAGRKNAMSFELAGADSALAWDSTSPDELWLGRRGEPNQNYYRDPSSMDPAAARVSFYPAGHVEGFGETFRGLTQQVYADVLTGGPQHDERGRASYPTFVDGLRAVALDDAIRRSASTGSWIDVEGH